MQYTISAIKMAEALRKVDKDRAYMPDLIAITEEFSTALKLGAESVILSEYDAKFLARCIPEFDVT